MGLEPTTTSLATRYSTTELHPHGRSRTRTLGGCHRGFKGRIWQTGGAARLERGDRNQECEKRALPLLELAPDSCLLTPISRWGLPRRYSGRRTSCRRRGGWVARCSPSIGQRGTGPPPR